MNTAISESRHSSPRLSRRAIRCEHCGSEIGICYGERILAVGPAHFLKLTIMNCAACSFQIRWAPARTEGVEYER